MLNRLSAACGMAFETPDEARYSFPRPEDLAVAAPETIRSLGFSGAKTRDADRTRPRNLRRAAGPGIIGGSEQRTGGVQARGAARRRAMDRRIHPAPWAWAGSTCFPATISAPATTWSAGCAFASPLDYDRVAHVLSRWKPYGGLIYFHLLLDSIARAGLLGEKEVSR